MNGHQGRGFILEDGQVQTIWIAGINRSGKCVAKPNTHTTDIFWLFELPLHIHFVQLPYATVQLTIHEVVWHT